MGVNSQRSGERAKRGGREKDEEAPQGKLSRSHSHRTRTIWARGKILRQGKTNNPEMGWGSGYEKRCKARMDRGGSLMNV